MAGDMSNLQYSTRDFSILSMRVYCLFVCLFVYFAIIHSTFRLVKGQQYLFILLKNSQYLSQKEPNMVSQRDTEALL